MNLQRIMTVRQPDPNAVQLTVGATLVVARGPAQGPPLRSICDWVRGYMSLNEQY